MKKLTRWARLSGLLAPMLLLAGGTLAVAGEKAELATVRAALKAAVPQADPDSLSASVIPGMYQAVYGTQILYVSADGRYLLEGDMYDLQSRINLTENLRKSGRAEVVNGIDPQSMIVFAANKPKYVITAFTDIDCGYCRKMHRQIAEYNDLGITMRYLAFPRSGVDTESYYKAVSVWCADNRKAAMTEAKSGKTPPRRDCDNPVKEHMAAARAVGVTGTPTLVLKSGQVIPGYVEPARLLQILQQSAQ